MLPPRKVARYWITVVRLDCVLPNQFVSDYWEACLDDLYGDKSSAVLQVYCTLGEGYFGM